MSRATSEQDFTPNRILVIRLSSIGDIVLVSPLVRVLKKQFPMARIDFLTKKRFEDLVRFSPHLERVLVFDERRGAASLWHLRRLIRGTSYDLIVDIHKNFRSLFLRKCSKARQTVKYSKMRWPRFLLIKAKRNIYPGVVPIHERYILSVAHLGVTDDVEGLELFLDREVSEEVRAKIEGLGVRAGKPKVGIAPGAGFVTKRWLPERYAELADMLMERLDAQVLLLGDSTDRRTADAVKMCMRSTPVDLVGSLSLMESACAVGECDLVVSNDTGLMHIASALKRKVVAIFGPTTEELGFFPIGTDARVVQRELDCRPCSHVGSENCPKGHFKCMRDICAEEVFAQVQDLMAQGKGGE